MILQKIELYLLVLSVIFCFRYILKILYLVKQEEPSPISINIIEKIFLYAASSYIITSIIMNII